MDRCTRCRLLASVRDGGAGAPAKASSGRDSEVASLGRPGIHYWPDGRSGRMRKFQYRTPRYPLDLPVSFVVGDSTLLGKCQEIGNDGMKVVLQQQVPEGTCGTLTIRYKEVAVDLRVCVAHS